MISLSRWNFLRTAFGGWFCSKPAEESSEMVWYSVELDRHLPLTWHTGIASQPFLAAETRVRSLRTGQEYLRDGWRSRGGRRQAHFNILVAHELHAGTPMCSPAPIAPEKRGRTNLERMQQHAYLARLCCGVAIPLALLAERTRTTTANAGSIHHAEAAIDFPALLLWDQLLISRAP